ncbi:MAG: hypothetical protein DWQ10_06120 [Calditrichaeota bacterium]|nr:MAG: hypothetical protein DWQ10_06120 [Calditrichota bacterium]
MHRLRGSQQQSILAIPFDDLITSTNFENFLLIPANTLQQHAMTVVSRRCWEKMFIKFKEKNK